MSDPRPAKRSLVVVAPRPPRPDGRGDQRRCADLLAAVSDHCDVEVISWLPDVDQGSRAQRRLTPRQSLRALTLLPRAPATVASVLARAPASVRRLHLETRPVLFVTDRACPLRLPRHCAVDFIDDLAGNARRRAGSARPLASLFWSWEARRLRRFDRRLRGRAAWTAAISASDAQAMGPEVRVIPMAMPVWPELPLGESVLFFGNLSYGPNEEAARWICEALAPALAEAGFPPSTLLISGREPPARLLNACRMAGVRLRPDVADPLDVYQEAAVVLAPLQLGSGVQTKVLDGIAAGRPVVLSPLANRGLGLSPDQAVILERDASEWATAIAGLLNDRHRSRSLARAARSAATDVSAAAVSDAWKVAVCDLQAKASPEDSSSQSM